MNIGETLTVPSNTVVNGVEVPTAGQEGVILSKEFVTNSPEGTPIYSYQVSMTSPVYWGADPITGAPTSSGQVFWFADTDLGNSTASSVSYDVAGVSSSVSDGVSTSKTSVNTITDLVSRVSSISPYKDILQSNLNIVNSQSHSLEALTVDQEDPSSLNTVKTSSEYGKLNSVLFEELSENIYGIYEVVTEQETQLKSEAAQAYEQESRATQDSAANFTTYQEVFVKSTAVNSIASNDPPKVIKSPDSVEEFDITNPGSLITSNIDFED